ncbi:MAG: methionyl-tRNA formyltransferase [Erysipelotrichia bacterium]|nr:methionyl-tRNA formyltransferase [Erysipelotrichia bacterium]NCC54576.1 methionyl-tRNA formyltransferase [Erysipelotrichia bacterium]
MGTPIFATAILEQLLKEGYDVVGVVSQPDKKIGRKQIVSATPVKAFALEHGIEVFQPIKIKDDYEKIKQWQPDLIVTCAYGQMIPEHLLQFPKYESLNVHASLLPKLRGGAPIHKAIIEGYEKTGVSIMRMVKQMDAGDYMLQKEVVIEENDTTATLHDKLMKCGASAIAEAIPLLIAGNAHFIKQKEEEATFAYNISKEEEKIDANRSVQKVYNQIRGLISWPVGYLMVHDKKLKIHEAIKGKKDVLHDVGRLYVENKKLYLQCIDGSIELLQVQLEGKVKCSAKDFINGAGRNLIEGE